MTVTLVTTSLVSPSPTGASWFGMEDSGYTPHGLDKVSAHDLLGFLKDNNFNAIRLPFSLEFALNSTENITK